MHCFGLDKELGEDIEAVVEEEEELDFLCLWQVLPFYFTFAFVSVFQFYFAFVIPFYFAFAFVFPFYIAFAFTFVLAFAFAFIIAFYFAFISTAQGDFEDPEFCMRYYHCNKDLRVSLNFHQKEFL